MAWFLSLPLSVRTTIVGVIGLLVGGQINRAIYRLAWNQRSLGPWSPADDKAPPRKWWDRLPVIGWFGLAREEPLHGTLFWFRPLAIEIVCSFGLALLYQWEDSGGLNDWAQINIPVPLPSMAVIHTQFLSHAILLGLMIVATFIDFDEKTIPDSVTITGTLLGFLLAAVFPTSLLPLFNVTPVPSVGEVATQPANFRLSADNLWLTSPYEWADWLSGPWGLATGLACIVAWWYALLPKTLWYRSGILKAIQFLCASICRHALTKWLATCLLLPCLALVVGVWYGGGHHWQALLTSLVGMAFGGGLVWSFRVVASTTLQQEALGFGDVTLMAMIGAFVGWQPALLIFFLAPFAGVVVAVSQWVITRRHEIAYGPYLCLATVILIVFWVKIWGRTGDYFSLGPYIPVGLLMCLVAMAVMLSVWLRIKRTWHGPDN